MSTRPDNAYGTACVVCGVAEWVVQFLFGGPMGSIAWSLDPWTSEPLCVRCMVWKESILG